MKAIKQNPRRVIITQEKPEAPITVAVTGITNLPDYVTVMFTAVLALARKHAGTSEQTEAIYDMLNEAATGMLHVFAPEIDMRPHLTEEAILQAENAIMATHTNHLKN